MCGIAGIVSTTARLAAGTESRALAMRDVMPHRGPDEAGLHADEFAVLAHRRLSIVDLSAGQQPLANEDGTVWLTYNGEIYNHADIRRDLESRGHRYRTRSDTETIVHAWEQGGDDCADRLRGMFAFGLWDARRRRLLLVRDRLGVKPLYWCKVGHQLLFASEIKALLASTLIRANANHAAIPEVLGLRSTAGSDTMFRGIHKLQPGHLLIFEDGVVTERQYWDVPFKGSESRPTSRRADVVSEFRSRLAESVRLRLMSDVPLGMFLSGGIDSSAIAAIIAGMIDRPLQTISVALKDRAVNQLRLSREVAHEIKAQAHEIVIDDREFFGAPPPL